MNAKSERKRKLILEKAERVFIQKGFTQVTMQDIIDACAISRGGIYLYFSSVDEIFIEVICNHHQVRKDKFVVDNTACFYSLLDKFFDEEKQELLEMKNSLKSAMYEFFLARKQIKNDFLYSSFYELKHPILEILQVGTINQIVHFRDINTLAEMIMLWIEGLEAIAVSAEISSEFLDKQIAFMKDIILNMEGK